MIALVRAGLVAALIALACLASGVPALAQEKAQEKTFQRADLADAAIKLEAQIKTDAGTPGKPAATLRQDADAAFKRNDMRGGMVILGQALAAAPDDATSWLRLSRTISRIRPRDDKEQAFFQERASTAAYIAYQRTKNKAEEGDALAVLGQVMAERKIYRPALDAMRLSLDQRETAELRGQYERLRAEQGFRFLNYTVDSDAVSPRACVQFSETLPGKKTDFSPFVSVVGIDKPAITANERQLCIDGLKHGERYTMTLRAGLPSTVRETLPKSVELGIYVRDRKPFARFSGKAYVLPRTGQRGIPVLSVNTDAIAVDLYKVGDRNLIETILGGDFQRALSRYQAEQIANERGSKIWSGELAVESKLNTEVTTAFPISQAAGELGAGVYMMTASPKGPSQDYEQLATQWFIVSDLGLTAYSGAQGIDVFIHSLATASPRGLTEVRLLARNNEVLATKRTDSAGFVHFDAGLSRGDGGLAPAAIIASERNDYAFISLKTPAFDLTDRGVGGRPMPAGLDAFVYTERGVYRSGETVHATALLRDAQGIAALNVPLTMIVERPDGVEYRRVVVADQGVGGRSLSVPLVGSAASGAWRVRAYTDPKRPPVGEAAFMVEDYVPDRLEFDLKSAAPSIPRNAPATATIDGRYLYGAPAANLELEGEVVVSATNERPGFPGYVFGPSDEEVTAVRQPLEDLGPTSEDGKAKIEIALDKLPATARPLQAQISVRLAESGGRAVERRLTLPVASEGAMIGIKPAFSGSSLDDGAEAGFDIIVVGADGKQQARNGLRYELLKVETRYQWYRTGSSWEYEPVKQTRRITDGRVDVAADAPKRISMPVQWGRYRLEVVEEGGAVSSLAFDAGFYAESSADTPDLLELALDKPAYRAGDGVTASVNARAAGKLTVNVFTDRLVSTTTQDVKPGATAVKLTVGKDWGAGAYVVATLRRPLDAAAQRMPGRAIGVQWFSIDREAHTLKMEMALPQNMRPNAPLNIPVKVTGLAAREEARIVVAAVDVGILNLTNYKAPAPDDYYLGQRRLTSEIRDLYGQLIDGMQGAAGRIRSGGDSAGGELSGSPPTQPPLALYSGIVTVGADGVAQVNFDIPAFAGTVRVMAIAWSKDKVGKASGDVIVRDPVVVTATLPRFMRTGDKATLQIEIDNVEGAAGDYSLNITGEGTVKPDGGLRKVALRAKQRERLSVPLTASAAGPGTIKIAMEGPSGLSVARSYPLETRPATQILSRRTVQALAKGESLSVSNDMFADFVPNTGRAAVSVALSSALDAAALLGALDRYPFGCSEQITSRAVALLYANELAAGANLALDGALDERIKNSISNLLARQDSTGGFGLWSANSADDVWLSAYVTDFLTRARERKFEVPDVAFKSALDRLRNFVANAPEPSKDGGRNLAYALYVLARNGNAPVGDLRYYADVKLADFATPIAKAQIAAALGMLGDKPRGDRVYASALNSIAAEPKLELGRSDFGSALRDSAAVVTLASEGSAPRATIDGAVNRIEAARRLSPYSSTQEQAWLVLAARSIAKESAAIRLDVNGAAHQGVLNRSFRAGAEALRVNNTGDGTVQAVVTVSGAPLTPEPAAERGLKIERSYFTLQGEATDPSKAKQNQRFVVVLKVTDPNPQFARLMVADYLPAGFEIDNPHLVSSGETGKMSWIEGAAAPAHSEFRDDRFNAAFERRNGDAAVFSVAYVVRAVSPGQYVLPQAMVEDMYRPDRFGRTATGAIEISAK